VTSQCATTDIGAELAGSRAKRVEAAYLATSPKCVLSEPRNLVRELMPYREQNRARSLIELAITLVPYLVLSGAMMVAVQAGYWAALVFVPLAGGLLLRLFLIQHDCGHGAFLPSRSANDWLGRCLGVLTLTPYHCWRHSHALHHAGSGNLDARGFGDIDTLTVREFRSRTRWKQFLYLLYRHPLVLLGIGPGYQFFLRHRLPAPLKNASRKDWMSALGTNLAILVLWGAVASQVGLASFLIVQLPVTLIAASVGIWLFYVQHQFEQTHWAEETDWSFHEAALHGSSHLVLPPVLRWFSANIGVHHVHHLVSRVPFYRLPEVLRDFPQLGELNRITLAEAWSPLRLVLWDEESRRMVRIKDAL
jgi:omega-6 fatty acid desaturase (delta-12 desaturase)